VADSGKENVLAWLMMKWMIYRQANGMSIWKTPL